MDHGSGAARCAHCGAALAPDAAWCSLCYTAVAPPAPAVPPRPTVAPPVAVQHVPAAPPVRLAEAHPLYPTVPPVVAQAAAASVPRGKHARPAEPAADDPGLRAVAIEVPQPRLVDAPAAPATDARPAAPRVVPTWPCTRCGAQVAMDLDTCPECGAGFMGGSSGVPSLVLPVVGDLGTKTQGQRYMIAGVVGLAAALVLVAIVWIAGAL